MTHLGIGSVIQYDSLNDQTLIIREVSLQMYFLYRINVLFGVRISDSYRHSLKNIDL